MNKDEEHASQTRYQQDLEKLKNSKINDDSKNYIEEEGKKFRLPYRMIKLVEFSNINKQELIDQEHSARLQYRLLLLDPVVKAFVEFTKSKITIIYNHETAENIREKVSRAELIKFLEKEGVHIDPKSITERDYDYFKEFYSYAFDPKPIRDHPPYGYTVKQWAKMKPKWEEKRKEGDKKKYEHFKEYQESYEKLHPEIYGAAK